MKGILINVAKEAMKSVEFEDLDKLYERIIEFKKEYPSTIFTVTSDKFVNLEVKSDYQLWVDLDTEEILNNSEEFEPGYTSNNHYKKAKFNDFGRLVDYDGFRINTYNKDWTDFHKRLIQEIENK